MKLRDYQGHALKLLTQAQEDHTGIVLHAPTGAGKSTMIAAWLKDHPAHRVLVLTHRQEIAQQLLSTFLAWDHKMTDVSLIASDQDRGSYIPTRITVAMILTALNRAEGLVQHEYDLIVVDECHHAAARTWLQLLGYWPGVPLIGLTATPHRLDGLPLRSAGFTRLILAKEYGATFRNLIKWGYLMAPRIITTRSSSDTEEGRFTLAALQDIYRTWKQWAGKLQTIYFLSRVSQCHAFGQWLTQEGVTNASITAATSRMERRCLIDDYRQGNIQVLLNVDALGEGFDSPTTGCVVLCRTTDSLVVALQQIGRLLRVGSPEAILLDCVGICHEDQHGDPISERDWNLDGAPRKQQQDADLAVGGRKGNDQQKLKDKFSGHVAALGALIYWSDTYPPFLGDLEELGIAQDEIDSICQRRLDQAKNHKELLTWAYCMHRGRQGIAYQEAIRRNYKLLGFRAARNHWQKLCQAVPYGQATLML